MRHKRLRNTSEVPDDQVIRIIEWIAEDLGITQFDVNVRNSSGAFAGYAYTQGSKQYHGNRRPFVVLRIGRKVQSRWHVGNQITQVRRHHGSAAQDAVKVASPVFPRVLKTYQYGQLKGRRYFLADQVECLVYLAAHELRHLWQAARWDDKRKCNMLPMAHGAKGRYSEIDTEAYAIRKLREWRKR